jgi:spore coat polysaccharide biosynthesis protein SpsF
MIASIRTYSEVDQIVLAISDGIENEIFKAIAQKSKIGFIVGSQDDVLGRLIQACKFAHGTDIFRLTTESPFTYYEAINKAWRVHIENFNDLTSIDFLPDGSGFEIIKLQAYERSWAQGSTRHRSEYCSLFIRENKDLFRHEIIEIPNNIKRPDLRLTVDNPEDLIICREIYSKFKSFSPRIPLSKIISYIDRNPHLKTMVDKYVDEGMKTMYL